MSFRDLLPNSKGGGGDGGTRIALSAAAFAGAAYMGFRLARLVNYWSGNEAKLVGKFASGFV